MEQQQRQGGTTELRAQLGAMSVEGTSVSAGPGEGGGATPIQAPAGGGATGGVEGGSRGSSGLANLNDRKRVLVASMSPEDVSVRYVPVSDNNIVQTAMANNQVLCVDIDPEMSSEWAGAGPGGTASTRMRVVQAALRGFVRRKASFNPKHRFAVLALGDGVTVVRPLTSDVRAVFEAIDRLQPLQPPEPSSSSVAEGGEDGDGGETPFDFSELLDCIAERFPPAKDPLSSVTERNRSSGGGGGGGGMRGAEAVVGAISQVRPVVRALVLYGRSFTCPVVPPTGAEKHGLLSHWRFFLDCLYFHRKPSDEGVICGEVFDSIATMETSGGGGHSYFLECGHNLQRLNVNMAALLAHPYQRDYQDTFFDKIAAPGSGTAGAPPAARLDNTTSAAGGPSNSTTNGGAPSGAPGSTGGLTMV